MESVDLLGKNDRELIRRVREGRNPSDESIRLVEIIDRLVIRIEEFEAGQATPRGRVYRTV